MRSFITSKANNKNQLAHRFAIFAVGGLVAATTLLNIAFSLAPMTMVQLMRDLMA